MTKKNNGWTRIMFRTFKDGQVIALFIDEIERDYLVPSYMHMWQHLSTDYNHIIKVTRRANVEEYAPLADELHRIGYNNIEVMSRRKKH